LYSFIREEVGEDKMKKKVLVIVICGKYAAEAELMEKN